MKNLRLACSVFICCFCMSCANCMDRKEEGLELHIMKASEVSELMAKVYQEKPIVQYSKIHVHDLKMRKGMSAVFDDYMLSFLYPHLRMNGTVYVSEGVEITQDVMGKTKDFNNAVCFKRNGSEFIKIR